MAGSLKALAQLEPTQVAKGNPILTIDLTCSKQARAFEASTGEGVSQTPWRIQKVGPPILDLNTPMVWTIEP